MTYFIASILFGVFLILCFESVVTFRNYKYISSLKKIIKPYKITVVPFFLSDSASISGEWQEFGKVRIDIGSNIITPARLYFTINPIPQNIRKGPRFLMIRIYKEIPFYFRIAWENKNNELHLYITKERKDGRKWSYEWQGEIMLDTWKNIKNGDSVPSDIKSFWDRNKDTIMWFIENVCCANAIWASEDSQGKFISTGINEFKVLGKKPNRQLITEPMKFGEYVETKLVEDILSKLSEIK